MEQARRQRLLAAARRAGLLGAMERGGYAASRLRSRRANAAFRAAHPEVALPPLWWMRDMYGHTDYAQYWRTGRADAAVIAELVTRALGQLVDGAALSRRFPSEPPSPRPPVEAEPDRDMPKRCLPRLALTASFLAVTACGGEPVAQGPAVPSPAQAEAPRSEDQAMLVLAEEHARAVLAAAPEAATSLGVGEDVAGEGYTARLGDYSPLAREEAAEMNARFLQDLEGIDRDALTGTAAVTYDVLRDSYRTAAARGAFGYGDTPVFGSASPYPVTQLSGPHIGLPRLMLTEQPVETPDDLRAYALRLSEMGRALRETREAVLLDAQAGVVPPTFALTKAAASIDALTAAPPAEHPLAKRLAEAASDLPADERAALTERATAALRDEVYPAYAALAETLRGLVEQAGDEAGVHRLEDGAAFYQHALDGYGAGGRTPAAIHALGLAEVERVSAEMNAIMDGLDATKDVRGTAGQRFAALADDPTMTYPNTDAAKEALLASLREQTAAIQERAPDWFGTLPPQPVRVARIPAYEQDSAPGGYYTSPSLDGSRPGTYWINLKDTADWPRYTLKTLTYHEAVPGHHFQIALQQDVADMPLLRKMMYLSEFGEGWALYAEEVADEMGMYEGDPLGRLGKLQSELFRAARLVVDTGLHDLEWTREEAIDWMTETTGETRASVEREVERYSVWPGQATSYKLGQLKILELRERAERALGDDFDIRAFHDVILLDGAMPLPVLEAKVDAWIESRS